MNIRPRTLSGYLIAVLAMILLGSATSYVMEEIHADVRRKPESIVITNLDGFAWERVWISIESGGDDEKGKLYASAEIGTVAAGETREVLLTEFKNQRILRHLLEAHADTLLSISGSCPRGICTLGDESLLLSDLPFAE